MADVDRTPDGAGIPDRDLPESTRPGGGAGAGAHHDTTDGGVGDADPAAMDSDIPDPIPEADSPETEEAWEESEAMGGEAPTG
jgi:hypothetical protein